MARMVRQDLQAATAQGAPLASPAQKGSAVLPDKVGLTGKTGRWAGKARVGQLENPDSMGQLAPLACRALALRGQRPP